MVHVYHFYKQAFLCLKCLKFNTQFHVIIPEIGVISVSGRFNAIFFSVHFNLHQSTPLALNINEIQNGRFDDDVCFNGFQTQVVIK